MSWPSEYAQLAAALRDDHGLPARMKGWRRRRGKRAAARCKRRRWRGGGAAAVLELLLAAVRLSVVACRVERGTVLMQASNMVQLIGVDALGLVSMVVHSCRRLAHHVKLMGGLLRDLELTELMQCESMRRPLEQLSAAMRRCYALVTACLDRGGYLHRLSWGTWMANELRAAEQEIDMFICLVPLIALVDNTHERRVRL